MHDPTISPSMNRLVQLTADLFSTDEYGVSDPVLQSIDAKLAKAADLITEAKATLASTNVDELIKAEIVVNNAKAVADEMVAEAKVTADLVVVKATKAAEAVLAVAKQVRETAG